MLSTAKVVPNRRDISSATAPQSPGSTSTLQPPSPPTPSPPSPPAPTAAAAAFACAAQRAMLSLASAWYRRVGLASSRAASVSRRTRCRTPYTPRASWSGLGRGQPHSAWSRRGYEAAGEIMMSVRLGASGAKSPAFASATRAGTSGTEAASDASPCSSTAAAGRRPGVSWRQPSTHEPSHSLADLHSAIARCRFIGSSATLPIVRPRRSSARMQPADQRSMAGP
mmetsp:Transcript_22572/g.74830  ORF Transcript_22572/g.74830 Transcript_22572/m.74830 type:complete len:225 (+) Transcript_22572:727-1401(+)